MSNVTPAERRALEAYARKGSVKDAAASLQKSTHTIERQLESARERLNVTTTVEAITIVFIDGK